MVKTKATKPVVEEHEIEGHSVQLRSLEGREELWIDGVRRKLYQTERGYTLYDDAYSSPKKSAVEAARSYLRSVSGKDK